MPQAVKEGNEAEKLLRLAAKQHILLLEAVPIDKVIEGLKAELNGKESGPYFEVITSAVKVCKELLAKDEPEPLGGGWTGTRDDLKKFDDGVMGNGGNKQ